MNTYTITILHWDDTTEHFTVTCHCPIDWVVERYHHESFNDFFYEVTK